jgi:hypothetical protein
MIAAHVVWGVAAGVLLESLTGDGDKEDGGGGRARR